MMMEPTESEDTPSGFLNDEASLIADAIPGDLIHDGVAPAFFGGYAASGGEVSLVIPKAGDEPVLNTDGFTILHDWNRSLQGARYTRIPMNRDDIKDTIIVYSNKASNNTDYLDFGYWISRSGGDPVRYGVDPFVFGSQESIGNSLNELTGYATYSGPATGIYVKKSAEVYDEVGQFTANTVLTARFNVDSPITDNNHPLYEATVVVISGTATSFRDMNRDIIDPDWTINFNEAVHEAKGGESGHFDEGATSRGGTWEYLFYGDGVQVEESTVKPGYVGGVFAEVFDNGKVTGAFATRKVSEGTISGDGKYIPD